LPPTSRSNAPISPTPHQLEAQIRTKQPGDEGRARIAPRGRCRLPAQRLPQRPCRYSGQIATVAPDDSANWLRLAKAVLQVRPSTIARDAAARASRGRRYRLPAHTGNANEEADCLVVLAAPISSIARCGVRRSIIARLARSARGRARAGSNTSACARITASGCLTNTVDADAASPRACFQFSEDLGQD